METLKYPRYVLGIDPSGNFKEGKGTTGWCVFDIKADIVVKCGSIEAAKCSSQLHYWHTQVCMVDLMIKNYKSSGIVVSMEDYVLYSNQAKAQINSAMETSQLIGAIKMHCYLHNIPIYIRTASQVKQRWADAILYNKNYINKLGKNYYVGCKNTPLCDHERDAIRHAVHCATFELGKREKNDNRRTDITAENSKHSL